MAACLNIIGTVRSSCSDNDSDAARGDCGRNVRPSRAANNDPHPRAPGALALALTEAVDFLCFPQSRATPMFNFFARSGAKIEKIDSLCQGEGS
jgi:hypothetical protein